MISFQNWDWCESVIEWTEYVPNQNPILSIICKASYNSIFLSSHHPIILSSCHPVIPPTGHLVIQSPCHPVIIVISSCHPIIMPSCLPVILLSWKISHLDMMPKIRYQCFAAISPSGLVTFFVVLLKVITFHHSQPICSPIVTLRQPLLTKRSKSMDLILTVRK